MENGRFDNLEDETFPPLPPPHSPGQGGREAGQPSDDAEEDGDESKLVDVPAAKRKGVKRPQPKLDSQRLISERGLPALRTLFDNVRFKGRGHEAEDLRLLMQKMENWAHRLYPKLQFEDFIDKVEKLGNKKDVQTCLKRIRLDMPLTHEDFMGGEEEEAAPESHVFGDPDPFNSSSFNDLPAPLRFTPAPVHSTPAAPAPPPAPSLTEEQRRRMELNRQRALERRLARQQPMDPSDSQTVDSSADEPTNVLNNSKDRDEEVEALEAEPASSTQQQQEPHQLPHTDSEPPAESPHSEREEEPGLGEVQGPGNVCEDGD
ncbi:TIMELESS-interacting protein [Anarhichas minor]|uniref:TIMELESS-interacting protein n=1 Tax=Anarhichas minor TaxID=65739 RepID=UPI003F737E84